MCDTILLKPNPFTGARRLLLIMRLNNMVGCGGKVAITPTLGNSWLFIPTYTELEAAPGEWGFTACSQGSCFCGMV